MPTYIEKETASDLSPSWSGNTTAFDNEMSQGTGVDSSVGVSLSGSETQDASFIMPAGVPNTDEAEVGGSQTVELNFDAANMWVDGRCRIVRLDAAGNIEEAGAFTSFQSLNTGRTFNPVAPSWGSSGDAEECDDRFAIHFEFVETQGMSNSITIGLGVAEDEVITDISEDGGSCGAPAEKVPQRMKLVMGRPRRSQRYA